MDRSTRTRLTIGALTGLLSLVGMLRLTLGAFDDGLARLAVVVVLLAMLPWVVYAAARARHSRLGPTPGLVVVVLLAVGFVLVWLSVVGPVLALACSLAAFALIWVADWPARRPRGEDRLVGIEELQTVEDDD